MVAPQEEKIEKTATVGLYDGGGYVSGGTGACR
jgi:hypothetical protein